MKRCWTRQGVMGEETLSCVLNGKDLSQQPWRKGRPRSEGRSKGPEAGTRWDRWDRWLGGETAASRQSEKPQGGRTRGTATRKDVRHFQASRIFFAQAAPVREGKSLQAQGLALSQPGVRKGRGWVGTGGLAQNTGPPSPKLSLPRHLEVIWKDKEPKASDRTAPGPHLKP